jgi:predicted GTPase
MGATGSGKTSVSSEYFVTMTRNSPGCPQFVNLASGSNLPPSSAEVQLANPFTLDGRRVVLIDTPGFDHTSMSDTDILRMIAGFLETT